MRHVLALLGMVFISVSGAFAQEHPANARLLTTSYFTLASPTEEMASPAPLALAPGILAPAPAASIANASVPLASSEGAVPGAAPADPQGVQSVFVNYNWQAYFGYTFFRFYEVPGRQVNTNGFNYSMVYYLKNWVGLDGEFAATKTSQSGINGWFLFGGGGPRFRWSGPRGIELWGHVLFGYSHFTPQTPFGKQGAFAFEAGGGGDVNIFRTRWALRVGADMVGSHYFGTYQYSPKAFAGVVYKF